MIVIGILFSVIGEGINNSFNFDNIYVAVCQFHITCNFVENYSSSILERFITRISNKNLFLDFFETLKYSKKAKR